MPKHLSSSSLLSRHIKFNIFRTTFLPLVVYGCENLSLTLRKAPRLRVYKNKVLRRIFGPKRDKVTGE